MGLHTPVVNQNQPLQDIQILLVEDTADEADILTVLLRGAGAQVTQVTYAYEALEMLSQTKPDLLICDVRLPDIYADQLIQQIRSQEGGMRYLPAIAMSTYIRETSATKMLKAGFDCYLPKTFDADELIKAILNILR